MTSKLTIDSVPNPIALSDDEVHRLLIQFLIPVPNHLAAAGKLHIDIPVRDIFGIGATSEEPENQR